MYNDFKNGGEYMSRKSAMLDEDTKEKLNQVKEQLQLKNDNDAVLFLLSLYKESSQIPKASLELLLGLQKSSR